MMKKIIFTIAFLCSIISVSLAQEKGDHFLGVNFGYIKSTAPIVDTTISQDVNSRSSNYNSTIGLSYSYFTKLNKRINFGIGFFSDVPTKGPKSYRFSINAGYGILYPIYEDFYVGLNPGIAYSYYKSDDKSDGYPASLSKDYQLGASAGVTWIPMKHFGMTVNLIALNFGYRVSTDKNGDYNYNIYSFNLSNVGNLQNQTFTVFYKFK